MKNGRRLLCIILTLILTVTMITIPAYGLNENDGSDVQNVTKESNEAVNGTEEDTTAPSETEPAADLPALEGFTAKAGYGVVDLSWTKYAWPSVGAAGNTQGFEITYTNNKTNEKKTVNDPAGQGLKDPNLTTASTSYQIKGLENGTTYAITIKAYEKDESASVETEELRIEATPVDKVSGLTAEPGNLAVLLEWNSIAGVTYELYRAKCSEIAGRTYSEEPYQLVTTVPATTSEKVTYRDGGLQDFNRTRMFYYKYYVKVVDPATGGGGTSDVVQSAPVRPLYGYFTMKKNKPYYNSYRKGDQKKRGRLGKNAEVLGVSRLYGRWAFDLTGNNDFKWMAEKNMRYRGLSYTSQAYSANTILDFVNTGGYSSSTPYLIWLSQYTQHVYILTGSQGNWRLNDAYPVNICATGRHHLSTITGTFKVYKHYARMKRSKYWFYNSTRWSSVATFHTRLYKKKASVNSNNFYDARIGAPISKGCVRLETPVAQWIYYNIPNKTTVVSY